MTDEQGEQEGEEVGAPVDERAGADDVLADVPAADDPLFAEPTFGGQAAHMGDTADAAGAGPERDGAEVVPLQARPGPGGTVGLRADFGAHLEANYQRLVAQLYAITLDAGEAHDAVQEAYSRAWRNWSTIGRSPDPSAWVRRVAVRSTARSWRRTLARIGIGRPRPTGSGVDERTRALLAALGRISPAERRAVVLFHMAGSPVAEIAAVEQTTVGTVQARLARARHVVTEGMADVLPAVLGADYGADYNADYGADYDPSDYGADYEPGGYAPAGHGGDGPGTGGWSDRYDTGGYAAGGYAAGEYSGAYGYEPGTGADEGERR